MRRLLIATLHAAAPAWAQTATDALEVAHRFAQAGAPALALERVARLQPAGSGEPRWAEWENLRCALNGQLGRHEELIARAGQLPATVADRAVRACLVEAARSAIALGQGRTARTYVARLLWRAEAPAAEIREARTLVIESYLADGRPEEAYRLMLRYQQDYSPLDAKTATRFVAALLAAGREKDAVNWFALLDDAGAEKLVMRLRTGLVTPEQAVAQARALLAKSPANAALWHALAEAAVAQKNRDTQIRALEHALQHTDARERKAVEVLVRELWQVYAAAARELANQTKLLQGDDAAWSDLAARRAVSDPGISHAVYAFLTENAGSAASRQNAQLQLAYALQQAKLERTAVRLFDDERRFPTAQLDPQARYHLGGMAADSSRPAMAARMLDGLAPPPGIAPEEWQLRLAAVQLRAGAPDKAAAALRALAAGKKLPPPIVQRAVVLCGDLADAGAGRDAAEIGAALRPFADPAQAREIALLLGRIAEAAGEPLPAANYYLQAALVPDARATDALALQARLRAGVLLARAGLRDDARAQLEWVVKNGREPAQLELARRELGRL